MWPYKRKRILIDSLQYRATAVTVIQFCVIVSVIAASVFVPLMLELDSLSLSWAEKKQVATQILSLHKRFWPPIIALLTLLIIYGVYFSHRIVGPLSRFRSIFKAIGEGNLAVRAQARKHDYLQMEAESVNEMLTALSMRINAIGDAHGEMRGALSNLRRAVDSGVVQDMHESMRDLEAKMEQLKVDLAQFRTTT